MHHGYSLLIMHVTVIKAASNYHHQSCKKHYFAMETKILGQPGTAKLNY